MTITWGTKVNVANNTANNWALMERNLVHDTTSGHTALFYTITGNNMQVSYLSVSGTTITVENSLVDINVHGGHTANYGALDMQVIRNSDSGMMHLMWVRNADYRYITATLDPAFRGLTNTSKFIGIATATVADTATATVQIMGVNENVSSLTAGTRYYVSAAGLTTTSSANIAGIALAANKFLIRPETA